jgi:iron complex outermembrane receptor protein
MGSRAHVSRFAFFGLLGALAPVALALAQEQPSAGEQPDPAMGIEEIVVTAQRRAENLQEVPIAVTAVSAETVAASGLSDVSQISSLAPNVEMDATSPFAGSSSVLSPYIRGIGQNDFAFNLDPGVGVYVDGVYFARTIGANVDLLDVDHIEVLKGPQGTLFGRNSIGGVLNIVTRRPSDEFAWKGEVTFGRYDRLDVRASVDIPLVEGVLYSQVSFSTKNRDGFQRFKRYSGSPYVTDSTSPFLNRAGNDFGGDHGGENQDNIRGKLLWIASDSLEVTLAADFARIDESAPANTLVEATPNAPGAAAGVYNTCINTPDFILATLNPVSTPGFPVDFTTLCFTPTAGNRAVLAGVNVDADPNNDRLTFVEGAANPFLFGGGDIDNSFALGSNYSQIDSWGIAGTVDWELTDALAVKSITAYRDLEAIMGGDSNVPFQFADPSFDTNQWQMSQELHLSGLAFSGRLNWLAGAYYFHEEGDLTDFVPFFEGMIQVLGRNDFDTDAWALFTHSRFAVTERLGVTVGLRYSDEKKEFEGQQRELNQFAVKFLGLPAAAFPDPTDLTRIYPLGVQHKRFDDLSTRFGVDYKLTDDVFLYATFSEGYKSGGWTTRLLVPETPDPNVAPDFEPETARSYELGVKSEWFDRRLQLNAAGFFTEYDDIQVTVQKGISPTFDNAGDGEIGGFEVEFVSLLGDALRLDGGVGFLDAKYTKLDALVDPLLTIDDQFVNTPRWSLHLGGAYTLDLASGGALVLRCDYSFKDEIANDNVNTPLLVAPSTNVLGLSATYESASEKWEVTVGGHNVTDERYVYSGINNPGVGSVSANYNRPAEWYVTLRIHSW